MRKIIYAFVCSLLLSGIFIIPTLFAEPNIQIVNSDINLGKVNYSKSPVGKNIIVRNTGTDTLHIKEAKPGCGCTITQIEKNNLAPGDSTLINFTLDISRFTGKITKNIDIITDDKDTPRANVMIHCEVERPFECKPRYLAFDRVFVGEETTAEIKLYNHSNKDAVIKNITFDNSDLVLNLKKDDILKKGEPFVLKGSLVAKKKGSVRTTITIELYHPDEEKVQILTYGNAIEKKVEAATEKNN